MKLHRGPMWCVASAVEGPRTSSTQSQSTVNVGRNCLYSLKQLFIFLRLLQIYLRFLRGVLEVPYHHVQQP